MGKRVKDVVFFKQNGDGIIEKVHIDGKDWPEYKNKLLEEFKKINKVDENRIDLYYETYKKELDELS